MTPKNGPRKLVACIYIEEIESRSKKYMYRPRKVEEEEEKRKNLLWVGEGESKNNKRYI